MNEHDPKHIETLKFIRGNGRKALHVLCIAVDGITSADIGAMEDLRWVTVDFDSPHTVEITKAGLNILDALAEEAAAPLPGAYGNNFAHEDEEEKFKQRDYITALEQFLEFGESSYDPNKKMGDKFSHAGYFSGPGWAARCLRALLRARQREQERNVATTDNPGICGDWMFYHSNAAVGSGYERTIIHDSDGNEELSLPGHLTENEVRLAKTAFDVAWKRGLECGQKQKAAEIRRVLGCASIADTL